MSLHYFRVTLHCEINGTEPMKIEALHDFHEEEFTKEWAKKFTPTPERLRLFETIIKHLPKPKESFISILELGIGPGFLAEYLLQNLTEVKYEGLDYSSSMLAIAAQRTSEYKEHIHFTQPDLIKEEWTEKIKVEPEVVVSTWTLHDLFTKENILEVYKGVYKILHKGGVFLNGDFIKPESSTYEYEGGRIKPSEHIQLLQEIGFTTAICIEKFDTNVENPTTANNYACFKAIK